MLCFFCALMCEAQAIIDFFCLKRTTAHLFPIYHNKQIFLIISGVGKVNAAAAASYLYQWIGEKKDCAWFNVGIAGHPFLEKGLGVFANKIVDAATQKAYYPQLLASSSLNEKLITTDKPEQSFAKQALYDMEASAFFEITTRFSTLEIIHSYKIVSDNKEHSFFSLKPQQVKEWIENHIPVIERTVQHLLRLASQTEKEDLLNFFNHWHFTQTQKEKLKKIAMRWKAINKQALWQADLVRFQKVADLLEFLDCSINSSVLFF